MSRPVYLSRGGEQVFVAPYVAEGVQFFGFVVKAEQAKLQVICDRYLNGPTGTQDFMAVVPFVMFVFNKLDRMYAKLPPDHNRGWYSEQEGAVWMPVWDNKRSKALWYHPYMVVSSSYAMAMGREIYGFPKEIGWFEVPNGPDSPETMQVETVVVKSLNPQCQAKREQLFGARIATGGRSNSATPYQELKDLNQLAEVVADRLGIASHLDADVLHALVSVPIPMVFLKQFRDAVYPKQACFQSVQEAETQLIRLLSFPRVYLDRYEIFFKYWASHPIRKDLGLVASPVPVEVAFWANFDFEIGICSEIWRA